MPTKIKQLETKRMPKLRFPEFSGEWDIDKLGNISERVIVGLATSVTAYYVEKSHDAVPIIRNQNIKDGYFDDSDMLYLKSEFSRLHPNKRVKRGDVITVHTGVKVGLTCVVPEKYNNAQTFTTLIVTPKKKILESSFLNVLLNTDKGRHQALRLVVGGGKGNLNTNDFKIYPVLLPSLLEQQKIAEFLGGVDEWIENLRVQKESLEKYKKGMMQKIFSQEIRFKDDNGNDFPEWEEKRLGDVGSIKTSSVDKKINSKDKAVKLLNYMDIYRRDHIFTTDLFQEVTAKDNQIISSDLKRGDILFTPSSETPVDIGHSAVVMEDLPNTVFSYHLIRLRPKRNIILPDFSAYAFKSFVFYKKLWRLAQGATRFTLSIEAFKNVSVIMPTDMQEQQKIAEFLTSLDNLIESKQQQIIQAEKWEKGLMQWLFV